MFRFKEMRKSHYNTEIDLFSPWSKVWLKGVKKNYPFYRRRGRCENV